MGNELDYGFHAQRTGKGTHSALKAATANGSKRPVADLQVK